MTSRIGLERLGKVGLVEYFKVFLNVNDDRLLSRLLWLFVKGYELLFSLNNLGHLFSNKLNLESPFGRRTSKKPRNSYVNPYYAGILGLDHVLRGLKACHDKGVLENDVGGAKLTVFVKEDLGI